MSLHNTRFLGSERVHATDGPATQHANRFSRYCSTHARDQPTHHATCLAKGRIRRCGERKCADTIGTVPVPWAGHPFPMLKYEYIFQIKYTEAILSNNTRKLLRFEIASCSLKNKFLHWDQRYTP